MAVARQERDDDCHQDGEATTTTNPPCMAGGSSIGRRPIGHGSPHRQAVRDATVDATARLVSRRGLAAVTMS
jgi:hypothetical protein